MCAPGAAARSNRFRLQRRWFDAAGALFFYFWPAHPFPAPDGRLVALGSPAHGPLAAPTQGPQNPPHMSGMKLLPSLSLDQIGHAPGRPERTAITQHLGPLFQAFSELFQLHRVQTRSAARSCGFAQCLGALPFPRLMPATDRLPVNTQSPGHFALVNALVKKPSGSEPSLLQFIEIAFDTFWISHARKLP